MRGSFRCVFVAQLAGNGGEDFKLRQGVPGSFADASGTAADDSDPDAGFYSLPV